MTAPDRPLALPAVLIVMGVSGSGKTTVARLLAERLRWPFEEGDALHPPANVARMAAGHALTDADRAPWLAKVAAWVDARLDAGECGVVTCSALKRAYRDQIGHRGHGVEFVWLDGPPAQVAARLATREGHFMPASLLASQFATLEPPGPDEPALRIAIDASPQDVASRVVDALGLAAARGDRA